MTEKRFIKDWLIVEQGIVVNNVTCPMESEIDNYIKDAVSEGKAFLKIPNVRVLFIGDQSWIDKIIKKLTDSNLCLGDLNESKCKS